MEAKVCILRTRLYSTTLRICQGISGNMATSRKYFLYSCSKVTSFTKSLVKLPTKPLPVLLTLGMWKSKPASPEEKIAEKTPEEMVVQQADELYSRDDTIGLYELLIKYKDVQNDDILWRLARATCDKGKSSANSNDRKACMYEAFEYIKKALAANDQNFAVHKWYAILLDYTGEYEGTKQRISNAFVVKEHLLKAIELNKKDATSMYSLGYWCFLFADMPWYQRKVASVIFTSPPNSSYEEALKYFLQAEETDPNFYSTNLLMLGKTYLRLKKNDLAVQYLKRARDYPVKKPDDRDAHKEAVELLKSLGISD